MHNLILKDILIQKKNCIFALIIYPLIAIIAFQSIPEGILIVGSVSVAFILISNAFAYDEKCMGDVYIKSLPVNMQDIVTARYLSLIVFSIIGIAVMYLYLTAAKLLGININIGTISASRIINIMFINILLYSIQFPLYYKFGFVKMRIFSNLVYIFFIIGLSTLCENISKNPEILAFIKAVHPVILSVVLIAAMIFMLIISAEISIRFYITREC
jgi:ABC-2 type transport system permease protein